MPLSDLDSINMKYVSNCISPADNRYSASASVINDLLLVKSKLAADVSVLSSIPMWISLLTHCVCLRFVRLFVCLFFFSSSSFLCVYNLYDFHNKINKLSIVLSSPKMPLYVSRYVNNAHT